VAALSTATVGGGAFGLSRLLGGSPPRRLPSFAVNSSGTAAAFRSRPDLRPTTVNVSGSTPGGYYFLGPGAWKGAQPGPLLIDEDGETVWFEPIASNLWATDVKASTVSGKPVMSWWQGTVLNPGYGNGEGVVLDSSYRQLARIRAANGRISDLHEQLLTPHGTALITCFPQVTHTDLSAVGGPRDGTVFESVFQEIDIHTGRLLFEWRSLNHIPVTESYRPLGQEPWDYLHLNSIEIAPDGNLLVSGRHTWTVYKLDRRTGEVIWRLGGKRSDFAIAKEAEFAWQHDARSPRDGLITLFDNGSDGPTTSESQSGGLVLAVDMERKTASLKATYRHPRMLATAMGNFQTLPNGHAVLGWGTEPRASEFSASGKLLADGQMPNGQQSYRAFRYPWPGSPAEPPALTASRDAHSGRTTLYVSWNGATDVSDWHVHAGSSPKELRRIGVAKRRGFETAIALGGHASHVAVGAHGVNGRFLAHSKVIEV